MRKLFSRTTSFFMSTFIIVSCSSAMADSKIIEECLGVRPKKVVCKTERADFALTSQTLVVSNNQIYLNLRVSEVQLLPNRITSTGVMEESLRFTALGHGYIATVDLPCGQTDYGYVGLSNNPKAMPFESVAQCEIE